MDHLTERSKLIGRLRTRYLNEYLQAKADILANATGLQQFTYID